MSATPVPTVAAPTTGADPRVSATSAAATDRSVGFRRRATAVAMVVGAAGPLVANTAYAWATRAGGDDSTGANTLALYSAHATAVEIATVAVLVGVMFLVPGLLGVLRLVRTSTPRLGLTAVVLMVAGYVAYVSMNGANLLDTALGQRGLDAADAIEAAQTAPASAPFGLVFIVGNLLGTLLLAVAVLRTRALPRLAGVGLLAWPVLHVAGLVAGTEWFEVAGAALQLVGLAVLATVASRLTDDEWVARG